MSIDNKIAELNLEIKILQKEKKSLLDLSDDERLAIVLHSILCRSNHTDGCSWFYEFKNQMHQWDTGTHSSYLRKSQKLIEVAKEKNMNVVDLIGIYEIFKEL